MGYYEHRTNTEIEIAECYAQIKRLEARIQELLNKEEKERRMMETWAAVKNKNKE
ncbi:MAG: hypothetical protein NC299_15655 [Lachnospiraceae bacterium]|nr:hypothetical protein [Ruminococcus sp.]MCM1276769.1 hypothetical protein [Lachnospiraceae bacterium]